MSDSIKWKILEDGTVSIETDAISGENHLSADQLLESLADSLGGSVDIESKRSYAHKRQHASQAQTHKH